MSHGMTDTDRMVSASGIAPWHFSQTQGRTKIVANALTAKEALVESGLGNWEVCTEDVQTLGGIVIPGFKRTYRVDNNATLGIVSDEYRPIQNWEAFAFADSLLGSGDIKYETAGSLYGGKVIWLMAHLPEDLKIAGDSYRQYFLLKNAHTGLEALTCQTTPIRVVCQNTLNAAIGGVRNQAKIIHRQNYETQLGEARKILGFTRNYYKSFAELAESMARELFNRAQFDDMLKSLLPIPDDASKQMVTLRSNVREKIMVARDASDLDNIRNTKWGAYNAVADYADHGRTIRGTNDEDRADRAFTRAFERTVLKDSALAYLSQN